ncbi:vWA domain-containing protein [Corynebacterium sp. H130]|uniref:vWA domain-containing protein n=1 Tax=Corynebacterium sp. H130 TaxID=3133444 RepID=UPI0030B5F147
MIALGEAALATPAANAEEKSATMLIIDASGSMANNDAGGKTRMEAARDAGKKFVDEAGELGLVTYGSKVGSGPALKEKGCADIDVVSKPAKGNAAKMKAEIDKLQPSGYTPIGNSLRKAAEQFGESRAPSSSSLTASTPAPRRLPARSQRNLKKGVDLVINTIGFNVDVRDAGSLSTALKEANTRTADRYSSSVPALQGASVLVGRRSCCGVDGGAGHFLCSLTEIAAESCEHATLTKLF